MTELNLSKKTENEILERYNINNVEEMKLSQYLETMILLTNRQIESLEHQLDLLNEKYETAIIHILTILEKILEDSSLKELEKEVIYNVS